MTGIRDLPSLAVILVTMWIDCTSENGHRNTEHKSRLSWNLRLWSDSVYAWAVAPTSAIPFLINVIIGKNKKDFFLIADWVIWVITWCDGMKWEINAVCIVDQRCVIKHPLLGLTQFWFSVIIPRRHSLLVLESVMFSVAMHELRLENKIKMTILDKEINFVW